MIKNIIFSAMVLLITGCANQPGQTAVLNVFTSADKFNHHWMLKHEHYEAATPVAKDGDWNEMMRGWITGQSDSGHGLHLMTKKDSYLAYDIDFYVSITPYTDADRALENGDEEFIRKYYNSYVGKQYGNGDIVRIPFQIKHYGKESYPCTVTETYRPMGKGWNTETYFKYIECSKFNPERTMAKGIGIKLIYTRVPNLPKELEPLAREYTYEDLQKRSRRILDSLYIKDGWEK